MEVEYNNTAGRVHAILREAQNHQPGEKTWHVWNEVFGLQLRKDRKKLSGEEMAGLYGHLVLLQVALTEVEDSIQCERPDALNLYSQPLASLKLAVSPYQLTGPFQESRNLLSDAALLGLAFCANELPKEGEVTKDELDEIGEAVDELFNQVKDSSIRNPLKRWILELLSSIKKSIDNYHIFGAKGLRESLTRVAGEIWIYAEAFEEVKKTNPTLGERFWDIAVRVHTIVMKAKECWPLITVAAETLQLPFFREQGGEQSQ